MFFALIPYTTGFGQSWKPGHDALMKNDFKTAQGLLSNSLKKAKSKPELATTYKYLGVAQYMAGNTSGATASFQKAKSMNPSITLTSNEVVDESVIPVFNVATKGTNGPARPPQGKDNLNAKAAMPTDGGSTGVKKQKSKKTVLKVIANVPTASVSLDGIAYGNAGQEIEVPPGTVVLEVSTPGYKPKKIKVKLDAFTTSSVEVNLEKIPPKAKPQPVPKAIPLPNLSSTKGEPKEKDNAKAKGRAKTQSLFADDPEPEMNYRMPSPPAAQQPGIAPSVVPPPAPQQPVAPQGGYGLAQPNPYGGQQYQNPQMPASPYPPQAQPQYNPQPQAYGGYPQPVAPQPSYPPPAYSQPYAQPSYPQPYGGYVAPPNPYAPPPPAPPSPYQPYAGVPAADPYGGYLGPPPESPSSGAVPLADDKPDKNSGSNSGSSPKIGSSSKSKKSSKSDEDSCGFIIKILPLGAGQFCHGNKLKGVFFLGSEAAALYFYKTNSDAANSYQSKLNSILEQREANRSNETDKDTYDAETAKKQAQGNAVINKANQNAQYSMYSFGGLYALGVLDAFMNGPSKAPAKKKKTPRLMHAYNLDLNLAPTGTWAMTIPSLSNNKTTSSLNEFYIGYTPISGHDSANLLHSVSVGITWEL